MYHLHHWLHPTMRDTVQSVSAALEQRLALLLDQRKTFLISCLGTDSSPGHSIVNHDLFQ